jgi:hypothetical protein
LRLTREPECLRVGVSDADPEVPHLVEAGGEAEGGRGLWLVDRLSDAWGTSSAGGRGKEVWFTVGLGRPTH